MNRLDMSLDDIIALRKAEKKVLKTKAKVAETKNKPKFTTNGDLPRQSKPQLGSKGQWRHDRFGVDDSPKLSSKRLNGGKRSPIQTNKGSSNGLLSTRLAQPEGPLLSRAAREANKKSAPLTTAKLRASARGHNSPEPIKKRSKPIPERAIPAPPPKPVAQKAPAQSIAIKGSSGPATVLVSNLDPEANTADLREYFGQFGEVLEVSLLYDEHSRCSGNAEIKYGRKSDAQIAVEKMHNVVADDRVISVQLKPDPTPPTRPAVALAPIHPAPSSRVEPRHSSVPSRPSSGPVRNSTRMPITSAPYSRPVKRPYRR